MLKKIFNSPAFLTVLSYLVYIGCAVLVFYVDFTNTSHLPFVGLILLCAIVFFIISTKLGNLCQARNVPSYSITFVISMFTFWLTKNYFFQTTILNLYSIVCISVMSKYIKESISFFKIKQSLQQEEAEELEVEDNFDNLTPVQKASLQAAMKAKEEKTTPDKKD